jgi:hypothetical protein
MLKSKGRTARAESAQRLGSGGRRPKAWSRAGVLGAAGGCQRLPVARAQPQLRPPGLRVPGPGAEVPVQAPGGLVADPDDPVLAALAADCDFPLP